jgi:hypothetical protein
MTRRAAATTKRLAEQQTVLQSAHLTNAAAAPG